MDYFDVGFSVRQPAWHGLATVLGEYPGREQAMELAGHNFTVVENPVRVEFGDDALVKAGGWKALTKDTDQSLLNIVRDSYEVVQNDLLWDIADALVNEENVRYETAGVLKNGAVLWVLARLDEPTQIPGDDSLIYPYACVSTTHDGSGACKAQATSVRVICWNTYSAAGDQTRATGREFTFRHTKKVRDRIEDAKMALKGVRAEHDDFMALATELAHTPVNAAQRELFLTNFIPMPEEALISPRVKTNIETARDRVRAILAGETTPEAHRETGYGLWQAGIEYLDHARPARTPESKFGRSILRPESAKTKLAGLVREVVKA